MQNFKRFRRKLREEIGFKENGLIGPFLPVSGPMGKNFKKWVSTFIGNNPTNMCKTFKRFERKLKEEIGFEELTHFCPFLGPWAKIAKSGLVLLCQISKHSDEN